MYLEFNNNCNDLKLEIIGTYVEFNKQCEVYDYFIIVSNNENENIKIKVQSNIYSYVYGKIYER